MSTSVRVVRTWGVRGTLQPRSCCAGRPLEPEPAPRRLLRRNGAPAPAPPDPSAVTWPDAQHPAVFTRSPAGRCNFDGAATTPHPGRRQGPGQPEPGRAGLVGHRDRRRQRCQPTLQIVHVRCKSLPVQLAGLHFQGAGHDRPCVHIQNDTRTLMKTPGPPTATVLPTGQIPTAIHEHAQRGPGPLTPSVLTSHTLYQSRTVGTVH